MSWLRPIDLWFSEQVLPHERHYLRLARRWSRKDDDAMDLVQEAYLKLLQYQDWRSIRDPKSYTVTMIRNLVLQRVRRSQIVSIADIPSQDLLEISDERPSVFDIAASREALGRFLEDIERLPPACRRVIRMRKFEDLPPREIAERLNISLSTVETHLARGMQQLVQMRQLACASQSISVLLKDDENERLVAR